MITPSEVYYLQELQNSPSVFVKHDEEGDRCSGAGRWHPAKHIGGHFLKHRLIAAWWILTNRAVAVRWF